MGSKEEEERKKRQSWYDNGSGYSGPPSTPAQKEYYDHLKSLEKKSTEEKNVIINARNQRIVQYSNLIKM